MMKRIICLSLLLCLLLCACGEATEPPVTEPSATEPSATEPSATEPPVTEPSATEVEQVSVNSAFLPYAEQENALGVILNEPFETEPTATVTWIEGEYERAYIIPRYVGSYVNLYELAWEEDSGLVRSDKAVQSTYAEDGCVIFSALERPDVIPMWCLEIEAPNGECASMVLQYNGNTGTPAREYLTAFSTEASREVSYAKPVLYLYPTEETEVTVRLTLDGALTCSYPAYRDGWTVTAQPDGTLTDAEGQTYRYLYWEGEGAAAFDFSEGFCVAGKDTAAFLEDALQRLGLNRSAANEFIVYWLPMMEKNPYNIIAFQTEAYADAAQLSVTPTPDTLLRVFMAWYPTEETVPLAPQELTAPERTGFVAVEWGGAQVGEH